jgi:hypothetical protein
LIRGFLSIALFIGGEELFFSDCTLPPARGYVGIKEMGAQENLYRGCRRYICFLIYFALLKWGKKGWYCLESL